MDISKLDAIINPSGTMAISNKSRELKSQGKPVIGFGAGEPDFPSPEYVVKAAIDAASDPKNHKYSPAAGLESLREVISKTSKDYSGFDIKSNNVIVSNGGKQSILTAFLSILNDVPDNAADPKGFSLRLLKLFKNLILSLFNISTYAKI